MAIIEETQLFEEEKQKTPLLHVHANRNNDVLMRRVKG